MIHYRYVASRALALLVSMIASGFLYAETITLQAIEDFPSINDGEVPYHKEQNRGTLAINAANEEFRNKFARATGSYSGSGGTYDLILNTVGEEDGECEYRILVNGVVVGTIVNDSTTQNFADQQHTIFDVEIPAGASLAVESNAVSNGLIPENGEYAFARGRWSSLVLQNDDPVEINVDLQVTASATESNLTIGDNVSLQIDVANNSVTDTATQPVLTAEIPALLNITPPAECALNGNDLTCTLPELAPQQSETLNFSGVATAAGQATLEAFASADQTDRNTGNNTSTITIDIDAAAVPVTVDLQLAATASTGAEALVVGDAVTYTLTTTNAGITHVATAPTVGVILPASLQFQTSADCSLDGENVLCELSELGPGAANTVSFTATAVSAGESMLIASVSAAEADEFASDNELVFQVAVITTSPATPTTDTDTGGNSGGGGMSLLLVLLPVFARQYRQQQG